MYTGSLSLSTPMPIFFWHPIDKLLDWQGDWLARGRLTDARKLVTSLGKFALARSRL